MLNDQPKYHPNPQLPAHYGNHRDKRAERMRGVLLVLSSVSLISALSGIIKLIYDVFTRGFSEVRAQLPIQFAIVVIAFLIGWWLAFIGVRRYNHLVIPLIIHIFSWGVLLATCLLYFLIIRRLYLQNYTVEKYVIFWILLFVGFGIVVALQFIPEGTSLSRFALPVLFMSIGHLVVIIYHYIFRGDLKVDYLAADMFLFMGMLGVSLLFISDMPFLGPIRDWFDNISGHKKAQIQLIEDRR